MGDGEDGARSHDLDEDDLDPGGARFAEPRAHDINGRLSLHFRLLIQWNIGHLFCRIEEGVFHHFGGDVLEGAEEDDEEKGSSAEPRGIEEEGEEDEAGSSDHNRGELRTKEPTEAADDKATEEDRDDEGADADRGADRRHKALVGPCIGVGELDIRLPGDLCQVDREAVGDHHDSYVAKRWGAGDEFDAIEEGELGL